MKSTHSFLLHSPLHWPGGKYYSAQHIVAAFPPASQYHSYIEPFGGAAHVLFRKPPDHHLEIYNDLNGNLVNFWMQCRDHPNELQQMIDTLPYSRQLYTKWHHNLFKEETELSDLERAVRWFYVLKSSFGGIVSTTKGSWGYNSRQSGHGSGGQAQRLHTAALLFQQVAQRFANVEIEHQDFAKILQTYACRTALFYCDPPYVGLEQYYAATPLFTQEDHIRLATLLNTTSALVAISYYQHPLIDELYPREKWRRLSWRTYKNIEKRRNLPRQQARELLLLNYPEASAATLDLWTSDTPAS